MAKKVTSKDAETQTVKTKKARKGRTPVTYLVLAQPKGTSNLKTLTTCKRLVDAISACKMAQELGGDAYENYHVLKTAQVYPVIEAKPETEESK